MGRAWVSTKHLKDYGMLGMNCRNVDFINRYNERRLFPLVDNKLKTKLLAQEYDVPTPWSVASVSGTHSALLSTVSEDGNPFGIHFSATGDKCFIMGRNTGFIYQYDLPTPWDLSSNVLGVTASTSVVAEVKTGQGEDVYFGDDGLKMYVIKVRSDFPASRNIYQYTLASAWDLSGLVTYDNISFDPGLQDSIPTGMTMSPDGLDMYIVGDSTNTVYHYSIDPI